ncbi:hypothetical protein C922_05077, partial [Plasmodium inui San Antonio 1]
GNHIIHQEQINPEDINSAVSHKDKGAIMKSKTGNAEVKNRILSANRKKITEKNKNDAVAMKN